MSRAVRASVASSVKCQECQVARLHTEFRFLKDDDLKIKSADVWFLNVESDTGSGQEPSFFVHLSQCYFLVVERKASDPTGIVGSCLRCSRPAQG